MEKKNKKNLDHQILDYWGGTSGSSTEVKWEKQ